MDLTTMTPQQIDAALYDLYIKRGRAQAKAEQAWDTVKSMAKSYLGKTFRDPAPSAQEIRDVLIEVSETPASERSYNARHVANYFERYEAATALADGFLLDMQPYDEEFDRRGGWNRAYLVSNSNGHVHKSMSCSTCFVTTRYHWVTEMSDHDEAEIVEKAGERACTVCYPSAPVEVLSRPTQFFTPDEQAKQKAREERERKAAEKKAAEITVEGFYDYSDRPQTKVFKSERAVTNAIAHDLGNLCHYGTEHPSAHQWMSNVSACLHALRKKGVEYDYEAALAKARKRVEKEMRQGTWGDPNFTAKF